MQRGRKPDPQTELAELNQGLATVEDPYNLAEFRAKSLEELIKAVRNEVRYAVVAMARAGRLFYALKERVEHGEWLPFLDKHHIPRPYSRDCMKMVEVIARYPKALHLPSGTVTNRLLNSSMAKIDAVLSDLPEAAIKQLTPWDLKAQLDKEKEKEKGNRYASSGKGKDIKLPPIDVTEFSKLVSACLRSMRALERYAIPPELYRKAKEDCALLSKAWDHASYNLYDPAHETTPPWETDARFDPIGDDEDDEEARA